MADNEKARLYRRIVQGSNQHEVLARMRVNGFWPWNRPVPQDSTAETAERGRIESEIQAIAGRAAGAADPEKALAVERRRRWAESTARRKKAREARKVLLDQRREAWRKLRRSTVVHLGAGVSAGLQDTQSNTVELTRRGLPVLATAVDVAMVLGVSLSKLRWLTYHRRGTALVHYHRFGIPKKPTGIRAISAPKPTLAAAQRWVLQNVLSRLDADGAAHGFVRHRSIVTNATPHVGHAVVINMDLRNFFPTVSFRRVKGLFSHIGYSEQVATVLSLLCTEPPRVATTLDGGVWYVAVGDRVLPQGACTSPALTNVLCYRMDRRLGGLARTHGWRYTRYADDLTFSGEKPAAVGRLLRSVRAIVTAEGFTEHPAKTRVMRSGARQEVTGLTVNKKVSVDRDALRTLRAVLHNCARHGLASQNREGLPDFAAYLRGRVAYVCMVDPSRGRALAKVLDAALASRVLP